MSIASKIAGNARFAVRTLVRTPLLTTIAVLTIALGIGGTTVVFSVINAVLLQPLPYVEPDRLVRIIENIPAEETPSGIATRRSGMSQGDFEEWRTRSQAFSDLAMTMDESATLRIDEGAVLLDGARVSPALFSMRGVPPLLGRGLVADDERPDAEVIVISEATWRRYLAADPNVIGSLVELDGRTRVVVGVMPQEFDQDAFWIPLYIAPPQPGRVLFAAVTGRLQDGMSLEEATAEANVLGVQLRMVPQDRDGPRRFDLVPELDQALEPVRPALRVLIVAVAVVLLIVCTNVANLLLARGVRRQHEIAIRASLGANRGRIARQMLTESIILAGFAGLVGVALAYGGVELLKTLAGVSVSNGSAVSSPIVPRLEEVAIDPIVLIFGACLSIAMGELFGALPAFRLSRFGESVRTSGSQNLAMPKNIGVGNALATAQIALAMILLVGAGLLLNSFLRLAAIDVGFNARNVLSFDLVVPRDFPAQRRLEVAEELTARLDSDPRISGVGYTDSPPLRPAVFYFSEFVPVGYTAAQIAEEQASLPGNLRTQSRFVSIAYLQALGARLTSGSWLDDEQNRQPGIGVLVSRPFARHYFGETEAVGSTIHSRWGELGIVGVLDDVHMMGPDSEPERIVFLDARDILPGAQLTLRLQFVPGSSPCWSRSLLASRRLLL